MSIIIIFREMRPICAIWHYMHCSSVNIWWSREVERSSSAFPIYLIHNIYSYNQIYSIYIPIYLIYLPIYLIYIPNYLKYKSCVFQRDACPSAHAATARFHSASVEQKGNRTKVYKKLQKIYYLSKWKVGNKKKLFLKIIYLKEGDTSKASSKLEISKCKWRTLNRSRRIEEIVTNSFFIWW